MVWGEESRGHVKKTHRSAGVDGVEVDGGLLLALPARQERHAWNGEGTSKKRTLRLERKKTPIAYTPGEQLDPSASYPAMCLWPSGTAV